MQPSNIVYTAATRTAIVSFPGATNAGVSGVLPDGDYLAALTNSGITDLAGNPLGGDGQFSFFFMMGDANHDRHVNLLDFNALAANFNQTGRNYTQGNFNYDGSVNLLDFNILAARFNTTLPMLPGATSLPGTISALRRGAPAATTAPNSPFASALRIGSDSDAKRDDALDRLLG